MHMSSACTAPVQPRVTEADRSHPLFPAYQLYRSSMANQLVEAMAFTSYCWQHEHDRMIRSERDHPRCKEFMDWMRDTKAGGRRCPVPGGAFPANFHYWLEGGRW